MTRSASGERKRRLIRSLDYQCVRRFRLRRLLSFLWRYSYHEAFEALSKETTVYFRVSHLQHMVRQGLWTDAVRYVLRFVPAIDLTDGGNFLTIFITLLSSIARYKPTVPSTFPLYDPYARHELDWQGRVRPGGVKVAEIIRSVCCKEAWGRINWALVRLKAAEIVGDLFTELPEFDDMRRLPPCPVIVRPANVLPLRASSRGHSRFHKKLGRIPPDVLARYFVPKETSQPGLPLEPFTMIRMAEILDECLQAGKCLVINDRHRVESSSTEGTKDPMVTEAAVPRSNLKRPRATEQEVDTRKIQIIGEHVQRRKRKPNTPISTATLRRSPRLAEALDGHKPEVISASKKPISKNKSRARKITLQTDLLDNRN
ncbi:hypothetical protein BDA96_06G236600 [Sorghum bicolor]|uniref:Uncharacterized protein n=2 Tax=Sorghum bicolor TaxID=4558 RepID=A0A921UDG4_SORBI|nr:uncharacterized protein LOC8074706 isoform X2 [Sorghum bicolor]EES11431.1 hypothetical protein SORBI_3006G216200 [Sorghum bicolor]KAG0527473.1 hypothetical protein BDA96_06G236600 [Sorghum bicolor]|eukprot:XP_002447103.1 uncharacterized protein LOC8074706 isoform X2 [Sorghum bicolor]